MVTADHWQLAVMRYNWANQLGNLGRREQALLTDQDNALVYRDDTPAAAEYFGQLATSVVDGS